MASLQIHLEWPYHAISLPEAWPEKYPVGEEIAYRLLSQLARNGVKATWYILGHVAENHTKLIQFIQKLGHRIGSHGYWHGHGESENDASDIFARRFLPECVGYISPFWDTTPRPGIGGGAFFRTLPYSMLKQEIKRSGVFYIHPHDLVGVPIGPLRRRVFLCNPWERLEHLLQDIKWES